MKSTRESNSGNIKAAPVPPNPEGIGHIAERRNIWIFCVYNLLVYLAAPVTYVGVVQAGLCDKLGANATIANLPSSAYLFGALAPIFAAWVFPQRLERAVLVWGNVITAVSMLIVWAALSFPLSNGYRIAAVIGQGLLSGFSANIAYVYLYQCLGRATTPEGRARAMKFAFTFGPIAAVIGSLGAQLILSGSLPGLRYPNDFALLYLIGIPCMSIAAYLTHRFELKPVQNVHRQSFLSYMSESVKSFARDRIFIWLWLGFLLSYFTTSAMPNLALYAKEAVGRDPKELSGLMMALSFGFKSLGGLMLGQMAIRWGMRAPLVSTCVICGVGVVWAWIMPGYLYLLSFGFMGIAELSGAYFPNYLVTVSAPAIGARNLALLNLASPLTSLAPPIYGGLTDLYGFRASFAFGLATALLAVWCVLKLPSGRSLRNLA
jgi:MFS family permease